MKNPAIGLGSTVTIPRGCVYWNGQMNDQPQYSRGGMSGTVADLTSFGTAKVLVDNGANLPPAMVEVGTESLRSGGLS